VVMRIGSKRFLARPSRDSWGKHLRHRIRCHNRATSVFRAQEKRTLFVKTW
jgi:hypothetical protein